MFPGYCAGEEEREPGTHYSCIHQVPLVTCIVLRYSKITVNAVYPLKSELHGYTPSETHTGGPYIAEKYPISQNVSVEIEAEAVYTKTQPSC